MSSNDSPVVKILNCDNGIYLCIYHDDRWEDTDEEICKFLEIDMEYYRKLLTDLGAIIVTFDEYVETFFANIEDARKARKYLQKNMIGYLVAKELTL